MLLADEQHGFRKNHSTLHSIEQITSFVDKKMDAKLPTAAVFIDFRKAFDCVQHPVLIQKLRNLGFSNTVLDWVSSYLTNREQRVFANDNYSDFQNITQGVPQGSVLGPLFYIIYANDIAQIVKNCKIAMYADDTVMYTSNRNFDVSVKNLQDDVNSLSKWCETNGIKVNTDKTKVMIFGSKFSLAGISPFEIKIEGVALQTVSSYKYLGLTLDAQLNYNLHMSKLIGSVAGKIKQFQRMRTFLSNKAALMVYKGTILPILEYGNIFFSAASAENRKRLQTMQNKGLRCAFNADIDTSTAELHSEAHLLKLHLRREQMSMKTRSSSKKTLKVKRPRTEKFKRSLAYIGPVKWNALPSAFHHTQTKSAYKSKVDGWIKLKVAAV